MFFYIAAIVYIQITNKRVGGLMSWPSICFWTDLEIFISKNGFERSLKFANGNFGPNGLYLTTNLGFSTLRQIRTGPDNRSAQKGQSWKHYYIELLIFRKFDSRIFEFASLFRWRQKLLFWKFFMWFEFSFSHGLKL